jgi:hypothetical protein
MDIVHYWIEVIKISNSFYIDEGGLYDLYFASLHVFSSNLRILSRMGIVCHATCQTYGTLNFSLGRTSDRAIQPGIREPCKRIMHLFGCSRWSNHLKHVFISALLIEVSGYKEIRWC